MKVWIALSVLVIFVGLYYAFPLENRGDILVETPMEKPVSNVSEVSTLSASSIENQTAKNQIVQPIKEAPAPNVKSSRVDLAYDSVNAQLTQLLDSVDVASLNLVDCEALDWQIYTIFSNSDLQELEGIGLHYGSDLYTEYNSFASHTLSDLATSGDFTAQQVYAGRLLGSLETFDEGLEWAHLAIARGPKRAISDVSSEYYNVFNNDDNATKEQRKSAKIYTLAYDYFRNYRDGVEGYLPDTVDVDNAQVLTIYEALFHEIHSLRTSLGLPEFVNRGFADYPFELGEECSQLHENEIKLKEIESGKAPFEY